MKMMFLLLLILLTSPSRTVRAAELTTDPVALAAQKEAEERDKRLEAEVQSMRESQELILRRQQTLQQRLDSLEAEVRALKAEFNRASANFASREELRQYLTKLAKEIDEKREADKDLVLRSLKELKVPVTPIAEPKSPARRPSDNPEEAPYIHKVGRNESLLDIIAAFNAEFEKRGQGRVTRDQVLKANPHIKNPNRLRVGQEIKIPVPLKENK